MICNFAFFIIKIMTEITEKPQKCPKCGSNRIATIFYGLQRESPELEKEIEEGRVVLGGCCIEMDSPLWQCKGCGEQFSRPLPRIFRQSTEKQ